MINIDYRISEPIYEQICNGFQNLVQCGALKEGDKIPSVRELAMSLSVNPNTVQKAVMIMEAKGLIYTVKGKGSYISDNIDKLKQDEFKIIMAEIGKFIKKLQSMNFSTEEINEAVSKVLKEEGVL